MASRTTHQSRNLNHGTVVVEGSFAPNGSSAVDNSANTGKGFTVARTGAGAFTITFADKYAALVSAQANIALNAVADLKPQFGAFSQSAKTLALNVLAVAVPTDIAANANNRIHFRVAFRNSSVA
jgi:hypothetical protein